MRRRPCRQLATYPTDALVSHALGAARFRGVQHEKWLEILVSSYMLHFFSRLRNEGSFLEG